MIGAENSYAGTDSFTFNLDSTAPTVTLTNSDSDNLIAASDTVTITTAFDEAMTATPTLSISGGLLSSTAFTSYIQGGIQLGADIDGGTVGFSNHQLGKSVSLSSDGSRAAIGSGYGKGHVGIYSWNGSGWTQLGANIDAEAGGDEGGWSVSLSSDGSRVAIGSKLADAPGSLVMIIEVMYVFITIPLQAQLHGHS